MRFFDDLKASSRLRDTSAAMLLVLMASLAVLNGVGSGVPAWPAGLAAWAAALLLWPRLDLRQRRLVGLLIFIGVLALAWSSFNGQAAYWIDALTQNNALLGMLVGVSFLQLLGLADADERLPTGRRALWQTLFATHLLGAAINLSAVFIIADRIAPKGVPRPDQAALLVRSFLAAAMWSPFFAAVAVAITYAPGASLAGVLAWGLPFAALLLVLAGYRLERELPAGGREFVGYPMRPGALWAPVVLAAAVGLMHLWFPSWSALAIITLVAPAIALAVTLWRSGVMQGAERIVRQARSRLPGMSGELALFLAAAVFASGLRSLMASTSLGMPFTHVGPLQAALLLALMIGFAMIGIHAVISISIVSAWTAPLSPDPVLMATVYCMSWAIGLAVSPLSGIHLALQGRYGLSAGSLARLNAVYGLLAYALATLWLLAIGAARGLF